MNFSQENRRAFLCECLSSVFVAGDTVKLDFIWPGPVPRGGQFFLIKPRRSEVFLGRPISVAGWKSRVPYVRNKDTERRTIMDRRLYSSRYSEAVPQQIIDIRQNTDRRQNTGTILSFFVVRRGLGSRELTDLRPGEDAELIGPLGNYWAKVDNQFSSQKAKNAGTVALVGGGVGIAPLLAYAKELENRPYDFYAGFRTGSYGVENIKPRSLIIATEDGSQGPKGYITDFFTPSGYSMVFACGPEPMLRVVGDACIASEIPCFISLERNMACGVGACLGCTVRTTGERHPAGQEKHRAGEVRSSSGNRLCCTDGPIFNAEEVCFDIR